MPELWEKIEEHRVFLEAGGLLEERRRKNLAGEVFAVGVERARRRICRKQWPREPELQAAPRPGPVAASSTR